MPTTNAVKTDLAQYIGTDHRFVCTEKDGVVLTGMALSFMLKRRPTDDDSAAVLTLIDAAITISGAVATVAVADTDTDGIAAGVYFWELKRMDPGGETVLGHGTFRLIRGVHHT